MKAFAAILAGCVALSSLTGCYHSYNRLHPTLGPMHYSEFHGFRLCDPDRADDDDDDDDDDDEYEECECESCCPSSCCDGGMMYSQGCGCEMGGTYSTSPMPMQPTPAGNYPPPAPPSEARAGQNANWKPATFQQAQGW